jgi:glycosyltransferase involved in cell wall biosynthesis
MSVTPFITVVMPVRNEARFIGNTLGQLLRQDYPVDRFEIIVADGMSDDGTPEIVRAIAQSYSQVRLFDNLKSLSSAGRNIGFKNGRGDYFLVVDGHCFIPDDQLLVNLVRCFDASGADCLGRPQRLDPPGLTLFQQAVALARQSRLGRSGSSLIYSDYEGYASPVSNGAAYRKALFEAVGYVDESFDACEDVEFNYRVERAGLKCFTSPILEVKYYPRGNLGGLFRQMARYGSGRLWLLFRHPATISVETLVPPVFICGLVALPFARSAFLAICYGLYLTLLVGVSLSVASRHGLRFLPYLPAIYIVVHAGVGWGFLMGLFRLLIGKGKPVRAETGDTGCG